MAQAALVHLLKTLRAQGTIHDNVSSIPLVIAAQLHDFGNHLTEVQGLQATTRDTQVQHVGDFLVDAFNGADIAIGSLEPADIARFILDHTRGWKPASVRTIGNSLRSYLRYKAMPGDDTSALSAAIPRVAQWRLSGLPKGLSSTEVSTLLGAFDRNTVGGRRDYAIARCYVDLGLRTSEVVRLRLDDIRWHEGVVYVRGKGRRGDALSLPEATGKAIAAYLRDGRGTTASRAMFLESSSAARQASRSRHDTSRGSQCRPTVWTVQAIERTTRPATYPGYRTRTPWRVTQGDCRSASPPQSRYNDDIRKGRPTSAFNCRGTVARESRMNAQTPLHASVGAYLAYRRHAGYELKIEGEQLFRFARFAEQSGHHGPLTIELAVRWAMASRGQRSLTAAKRIEVVRGFARYCQQFEPETQVPPLRLFGSTHRRLTPHIYTDAELRALLAATAHLFSPGGLRGSCCRALFGLLASTGLRLSEATGLERDDVDLAQGLLHIRHAKFGKSRLVPLHCTTTRALKRYAKTPDLDPATARTARFFVGDYGRAAQSPNVEHAFRVLRRRLQWKPPGQHRAPRIHDLRHTFICATLLRWYKDGIDIDRNILALSTYVGHVKVTDTYWYVTATPALMAVAAQRFQRAGVGEPS